MFYGSVDYVAVKIGTVSLSMQSCNNLVVHSHAYMPIDRSFSS